MVFSDFTYNGITFSRFVRSSGYMADAVMGDKIQIRSTKDPLPSQNGIQRYLDFYGPRLLEIRGSVMGSTETDLYNKIIALQTAFDVKNLEALGLYGFQPLQWTDPGQYAAAYYVKPIQSTLIVQEQRTALSRKFSVLLEAKDPQKYRVGGITTTIVPNASVSPSSALAHTLPMIIAGSTTTGQGAVTNGGASEVFPNLIKLFGPTSGLWSGPKVTNLTTGEFMQWENTVSIGVGDVMYVTPSDGRMYIVRSGSTSQEDQSAYLSSGSTYLSLPPGTSNIQIEGSVMPSTVSAQITVTSSF